MIGVLISFLVKRGIQSRIAAPLVYGGLILLAAGALWGLATCVIHRHDKAVVSAYENGVQATVNTEVATGTNAADAQANVTAAVNEERHNQVEEAINNAVTAHPVQARQSAGPASSAVIERLRHRPR